MPYALVAHGGLLHTNASAENQRAMVFFFERQAQFIRCESRPSDAGLGYELLVLYPDGREEIEHFDDTVDLNRREVELETALVSAGWFGPHGRVI